MIKVINDDFRNVLKTLNKDKTIIITDPPYNIGYKYNEYPDNLTDDDYQNMLAEMQLWNGVFIGYAENTMKDYVVSLGIPDISMAWCYASNLPGKHFRLINFYGVEPVLKNVKLPYKNPNDKRIKKLIENGSEGRRCYTWFDDINLVKNVSKNKESNTHTCPVPEKLIERIILLIGVNYIKDNDITIFDPFGGSGTTAKVCQKLGINCTVTEISEEYCEIAKQRLNRK